MALKISFTFKSDDAGFSENWYSTNGGSAGASTVAFTPAQVANVMQAALAVAATRTGLLGQGVALEQVRLTDLNVPGSSAVTSQLAGPAGNNGALTIPSVQVPGVNPVLNQIQPGVGGSSVPYYPYSRDVNWTSIDCRATSTNLYRRQVYLRGIPDIWVAYDTNNNPTFNNPVFIQNFNLFLKAVVQNNFCIQCLQKSPALLRVPIIEPSLGPSALIPPTSGVSYFEFALPAGAAVPAVGSTINCHNFKGVNVRQINGKRTVLSAPVVGGQQFVVVNVQYPQNNPEVYYTGTGYYVVPIYNYPAIDNILVRKYGERKVGRRFFKQPGKLSPKKPW